MCSLTLLELYTYSIDLSASWTNETVLLNRIDKTGAPLFNAANLWMDPSRDFFYSYNGAVSVLSDGIDLPANELWQFKPSGNSGTWSLSDIEATSNFTDLVRVQWAASAFGGGIAYALGGYQDWRTTFNAPFYDTWKLLTIDTIPVPGMVAYDMNTGSWSNVTTATFTKSGSFVDGQLQYLPGYGAAGLLIPLGGATSTALTADDGRTAVDDFTTLSMYDIASGTWHTQKTTGDHPQARVSFCSVGVQGDGGTFEVRSSLTKRLVANC
jgi:hypothetical protein